MGANIDALNNMMSEAEKREYTQGFRHGLAACYERIYTEMIPSIFFENLDDYFWYQPEKDKR